VPNILSAVTLDISASSPGPLSVTVPSGAQGVIVFWRAAFPESLALTSSFAGAFQDLAPSADFYVRIQVAPVTGAGSQTITPVFSDTLFEGPVFTLVFIDGIDNSEFASWVRDWACSGASSQTVDSTEDDLVVAFDNWFTDSASIPVNESGWTSVATQTYNSAGARTRSADSPGASTTTATCQTGAGGDYSGMALISVIAGGGGGTPVTSITSLSIAVQLAQSAAASVGVAVQAPQLATTSVGLAVRAAQTAATSLSAAVQQAKAANALVQVAVQAPQSASTSVATAVQLVRTAAANLDLAIQQAQALGMGVSLQVQADYAAATSVSLQVQAGAELSAAVAIAVQELRQASASVDLQIQEGASQSLALQAAVQFAADASAAISMAVAELRLAGVGLAAAVSLSRTLGAAVDAYVRDASLVIVGLSLFVLDEGSDDGESETARYRRIARAVERGVADGSAGNTFLKIGKRSKYRSM
jgi:hypothetical protein